MVRGETVTPRDFMSHRALGLPLTNPALAREWAEGVSVYDDFDRACKIAARFRFRFGTHLVRVALSDASTVECRQTSRDRHHYTIYAEPETIMALVQGAPIKIPGAPEV
jgi:hypothetical protein